MSYRGIPAFVLATILAAGATPAFTREHRAVLHPLLKPVLEKSAAGTPGIPADLKTAAGGFQGRDKIDGKEALSLFVRTTASRQELEKMGVVVHTLSGGRATVTVLPEVLAALARRGDVSQITLPQPLFRHLDKSVPDTGISVLRSQSGGVWTGATGAGVIVGVIDSGIDVDHPNFEDAFGNTRILYVWDQLAPTVAGAPFNKGVECTGAQIDLGQCNEQDIENGHGTHVTGIAAGSGAAPDPDNVPYTHVGVAPESKIIFVKLDFQSNLRLIQAMQYIFQKADALGMPAVINLSLGTHVGAHDGTNPIEEEIDDLVLAQAGRAVVVSAGNEGDDDNHGEVNAQQGTWVAGPTLWVPSYTAKAGSGNDLVFVTGYYNAPHDITARLISPAGSAYLFDLQAGDGCQAELNGPEGAVQVCNSTVSVLGQGTTAREIFIQIRDKTASQPPKNGAWKLAVYGESVTGTPNVDFWVSSTMVDANLKPARFTTLVDPYETVAMPATAHQAITVGSYNTRLCWTNAQNQGIGYSDTTLKLDELSPFSSQGPTRDGRGKPDLAAPGMGIVSALAAEIENNLPPQLILNDSYQLMQGTSQAAPHVTGAAALLLQAQPGLTGAQLKTQLQSYSRRDTFVAATTGFLFSNYAFGAGKLDLGSWGFPDPNETNDTAPQATLAISGQIFDGYIDRNGDVDLYFLQGMRGGDKVDVNLTSLPADYALALLAPVDNDLLSNCNAVGLSSKASSNLAGTSNESLTHTSPSLFPLGSGPAQYVRVTGTAGAFNTADTYQVKAVLTRTETSSTHNTTATSQALPDFVEIKVAGNLSAVNEKDYYSFTAWGGTTVIASAPGKSLEVRDASNNLLLSGASINGNLPSGGFQLAPSKYHIVVKGAVGTYTLTTTLQ